MDTNSFIFQIKTEDFYKAIADLAHETIVKTRIDQK